MSVQPVKALKDADKFSKAPIRGTFENLFNSAGKIYCQHQNYCYDVDKAKFIKTLMGELCLPISVLMDI